MLGSNLLDIRRRARRIFRDGPRGCLPIPFLVGAAISLLAVGASYWHVYPPYPLENERFGVGLAGSAQSVLQYDLEALGASWYLNWWTALDPPHPNGAAFVQTIRLNNGNPVQDPATLSAIVSANPGAVWQIGNEPDSPWMDNTTPEQYAKAYHDLYHLVKAEDPMAQVAFGGLVQATPLRMLYMDHIWQAYQDSYGEEMPVDVWTVHGFILREGRTGWGAAIPPGMDAYAYLGMDYQIRDHDDMGFFIEQVVRFRQWMADRGQREKPLLVPEYGILMWSDIMDEDGQDFSDDRVSAFICATFDYFRTATDPSLGYPADGNRLVQAWAWYSLGDDTYQGGERISEGYNGDLFTGPGPKTITPLGQAYADYVHDQVGIGPDYTDLWPLQFQADLEGLVWGQTATIPLTVEVANHGRRPAQSVEVRFWDGEPGVDGIPIGSPQVISEVPGRYEGTGLASVAWMTHVSGSHTIWVEVDPQDDVSESDEGNNRRALSVRLEGDLLPVSLRFVPSAPLLDNGTITVTATAVVNNAGWVGVPSGVEVWLWIGEPGQGEPAERWVLDPVAAGDEIEVAVELPFASGLHRVTVQVDPADAVIEADEGNNSLEEWLLVATTRIYLPVVMHNAAP